MVKPVSTVFPLCSKNPCSQIRQPFLCVYTTQAPGSRGPQRWLPISWVTLLHSFHGQAMECGVMGEVLRMRQPNPTSSPSRYQSGANHFTHRALVFLCKNGYDGSTYLTGLWQGHNRYAMSWAPCPAQGKPLARVNYHCYCSI